MLALHFTKPSNSEASVLASILRNLDPDVAVDLLVNKAGTGDKSSHFRTLDSGTSVTVTALNVGLPVDTWAPASSVLRLLVRCLHPLRRLGVVAAARRRAPDIVYTSQQRFDCRVGEIVARRLGVPHVVHLHYIPGPWLRRHALARLRTCDMVIAISEFIAARATELGVRADRIVVIPNTVTVIAPAAPSERPSHPRLVLGQVGRMSPNKGFLDTLEVFRRIHARSVELILVGDGPDMAAARRFVEEHGLGDAVIFAGWQADVRPWLDRMDIFVHPSREEPFGLSVLEAMAAGLPVVAYGDGGVSEIVVEGHTGHLVEPGDLDLLARRVVELLEDAVTRHAFGVAGRRRAESTFAPVHAGAAFSAAMRSLRARDPSIREPGGHTRMFGRAAQS